METNARIDSLRQLRFSAALPESVRKAIAEIAVCVHYPAGTTLFQEGAVHDQWHLIQRGLAAVEMNVPGRGRSRILTLGPGDAAAWSSLLGDGRMTAAVVAIEPTDTLSAPAAKLRELCDRDHEFGYHLMRAMAISLANRLAATRLQLLDLFGEAAPRIPFSPEARP